MDAPPKRGTEDIGRELECLSDAQWAMLRRIASAYQYAMDPEDLLQEAIKRTLEGERTCDVRLNIITFLANVMKSIASGEHKKNSSGVIQENFTDADGQSLYEAMDGKVSPEERALWKQHGDIVLKDVFALFEDDQVAKDILEARMAELSAEETRELLTLTPTEYNSKLRLIRRHLNSAFPQGWR